MCSAASCARRVLNSSGSKLGSSVGLAGRRRPWLVIGELGEFALPVEPHAAAERARPTQTAADTDLRLRTMLTLSIVRDDGRKRRQGRRGPMLESRKMPLYLRF
jgi:hypothetical protein